MNITWIKCSEQMPPDDYNYTVVARADMHSGMPFLTDGDSQVGVVFEPNSFYPYSIEMEEMEQILSKMKALQGENNERR